MVILDASVVVAAALVDDGPDGRWADGLLAVGHIAAPHILPAEVANVLRRTDQRGDLSLDLATLAMEDLAVIGIELVEFAPFSVRVWELRSNLTSYDAWYVALAEMLGEPLATLDRRLASAPGLRCELLTSDQLGT